MDFPREILFCGAVLLLISLAVDEKIVGPQDIRALFPEGLLVVIECSSTLGACLL
jgi:hypothetical protein